MPASNDRSAADSSRWSPIRLVGRWVAFTAATSFQTGRRGAALYLTRYGWLQGDFFDLLADAAFPPACSLGAINICAHGRHSGRL
jgi:hypothetical protein